MSNSIENILDEFKDELTMFNKEFNAILEADIPFLKILLKYVFKNKGKQLRPLFVILSSGMCGKITDETYKASALIEILHTATLIHDDVVDEADRRRGRFTVNAVWKNKAAVLLGDYMLAKGLNIALDNDYFQLLKIVSVATRQMSEGELLQMKKARNWNVDEATYLQIIEKKTASFFGVCFRIGGHINNCETEIGELLYQAGIYAGIAFQIKDDILDFNLTTGEKNSFIDLQEKKLTLPVIHALAKSSYTEKRKYINFISNIKKNKQLKIEIRKWLDEKESIQYSYNMMSFYIQKSLDIMSSFPDNRYKHAIKQTIEYLCVRTY